MEGRVRREQSAAGRRGFNPLPAGLGWKVGGQRAGEELRDDQVSIPYRRGWVGRFGDRVIERMLVLPSFNPLPAGLGWKDILVWIRGNRRTMLFQSPTGGAGLEGPL